MEKLEIVYNTIAHKEQLKNTRLSVVLSTEGLCFFIDGSAQDQAAIFYARSFSIQEKSKIIARIMEEYQVADVQLYYDDPRYSLIPRNLFLYGYEKDYVRNIFEYSNKDVLFNDQLSALAAVNVYAYSLSEDLYIRQQFPGIKTKHIASSIIETFEPFKQGVLIYFTMQSMYCIERKAGHLEANVRYNFRTKEDILYYIRSFIGDQVTPENIILAGLIPNAEENIPFLKGYLNNISQHDQDIWINSHVIFNSLQ